jgi:hypothetical protein
VSFGREQALIDSFLKRRDELRATAFDNLALSQEGYYAFLKRLGAYWENEAAIERILAILDGKEKP